MRRPRRVVIVGNTGAGKSTLARQLAEDLGLVHLDLDTVAWEPGKVAVPRSPEAVEAHLAAWLAATEAWVAEGSYASLAARLAPHADAVVHLDPPLSVTLAHQRARPWEPHKYADPAEQARRLPALLEWTRRYATRDDEYGRAAHQRVLEGCAARALTAPSADAARAALGLPGA